jgi:16S rRNA (cytidine1402-2'-O)-methyltransferase
MPPRLILLPNLLDEELSIAPFLPSSLADTIKLLTGLYCESEKAARRYLLRFITREAMQSIELRLLNEHTQELYLPSHGVWGVLSDAGLPCIADPGANLVALCHQRQIRVETVPGPSSILMALQLSGLSGQSFTFHGYLPREKELLAKALQGFEKKRTHLFIETPYRNGALFSACIEHLKGTLCLAIALTTAREKVLVHSIADWRRLSFIPPKEPTVFVYFD